MTKALESQINVVNVIVAEASEMYCQLVESAFRRRRFRVSVLASAVKSVHAVTLLKVHAPDVGSISDPLQEVPLAGFAVRRDLRPLKSRPGAVMLLSSRERPLVIDAFR